MWSLYEKRTPPRGENLATIQRADARGCTQNDPPRGAKGWRTRDNTESGSRGYTKNGPAKGGAEDSRRYRERMQRLYEKRVRRGGRRTRRKDAEALRKMGPQRGGGLATILRAATEANGPASGRRTRVNTESGCKKAIRKMGQPRGKEDSRQYRGRMQRDSTKNVPAKVAEDSRQYSERM